MIEHQLPSNFRVSVKALITDDAGRLLLVKEGKDEWGIPGGGIDHGETVEAGLRREIREELGVDLAEMSPLPVHVSTGYEPPRNRYKLWVCYRVKLAGKPLVGADAVQIGYFTRDEVIGLELDATEDSFVRAVFELAWSK
jgi:ADP-ribose pyrophosphatase YjhB (NUDIX family)